MDGANGLFWNESGFILLAKISIKFRANAMGTSGKSQYCRKRDPLSVWQHLSHKIPRDVTVWSTLFHHSVINIAIMQFVSTTSVIWDQTIIVPQTSGSRSAQKDSIMKVSWSTKLALIFLRYWRIYNTPNGYIYRYKLSYSIRLTWKYICEVYTGPI